jgi:hypothetical protein
VSEHSACSCDFPGRDQFSDQARDDDGRKIPFLASNLITVTLSYLINGFVLFRELTAVKACDAPRP